MTAKRKTRAELEAEIHALRERCELGHTRAKSCEQEVLSLRSKCDELKTRLAYAESEMVRQRGYIERVQEDDVVREELVTIGDPEGEQRLTPKRKFTPAPIRLVDHSAGMATDCAAYGSNRRTIEKRGHWVTY